MRRMILWLMLLAMLLAFTGCTELNALSRSDALPDLRLLEPPAYETAPAETVTAEASETLRMDLWLDASQVMGGINPNEKSMYPHASRKYREGGFHYRYENTAGMYETVLRCMLSGMEGTRVRLLRYGNERLPDDYLASQGLASSGTSAEELRSIRRDMLTYAIDPMPTVLTAFSGEKMTDSFYSLGTPKLNQQANLNASQLENPALREQMNTALDGQIKAISENTDAALTAVDDDSDYPLLYALNNIDLNRLSVITCDPASIRRLTTVSASGNAEKHVQNLLEERGVFDAGLSAGLYAFTLDYMGQLATFGAADLSEPLLWGRLDYNNYTGKTDGELVMPRTLLTLVIGKSEQIAAFTAAFEAQLAASDTLRVPRGPQAGQLTYAQNGETITQEPFGFRYEYLQISREEAKLITQDTPGAELNAGDAPVSQNGALNTITLAPVSGEQPDRTLTLSLPLPELSGSLSLNDIRLENISVTVADSLLLSNVVPNQPDTVIPEGAQSIALRDQIYLFTALDEESPVCCTGIEASGGTLTAVLQVNGAALKPGYYRLLLSADLPSQSYAWETPQWVSRLNATLTNEQISAWETFSNVLTKYERKREYITKAYQHAWGDASNTSYYGEPVPDFPPVTKAPGLSELLSQLQSAAHPHSTPLIRYVFDLFVTNQP